MIAAEAEAKDGNPSVMVVGDLYVDVLAGPLDSLPRYGECNDADDDIPVDCTTVNR
jgi:hypothetical protein